MGSILAGTLSMATPGPEFFPRPALTVDALVLAGTGETMSVLLIRRAKEPGQGLWALPGGFVDLYEQPRQAASRELQEETGLVLPPAAGLPLSLRSRKGRDPRGWTLSQPYLYWLPAPLSVGAGDDAAAAAWVPLAELGPLAFDHGAILCEGLGRFWPGMPGADPFLADSVQGFGVRTSSAGVVYFGGTFRPWHAGHSAAISSSPAAARVIVVPDYNPWKEARPGCAFQSYLELRRLSDGVAMAVYPGFLGCEDPNPSVYWLRRLAEPRAILLGADSFMRILDWEAAPVLLASLSEIFVARRGVDLSALEEHSADLKKLHPTLQIIIQPPHLAESESSSALRREI